MDKPRHPHVVRTWTVDRIRMPAHGMNPIPARRTVTPPHAAPRGPAPPAPKKP